MISHTLSFGTFASFDKTCSKSDTVPNLGTVSLNCKKKGTIYRLVKLQLTENTFSTYPTGE